MTDPRIPDDLQGYQPDTQATHSAAATRGVAGDPLGWCVIATTALLTWLVGPIALAVLAAIGFIKYWRAWRSGRTDSNCILGDVRIVLAYLAALTLIGAAATAMSFL